MAYLPNPNFGLVPGAPAALNWWEGPQFRMSSLLASLPPPAPPAPPLAATVTPQDVQAMRATAALTDTGGAQPGGGGPGTGPGGLGGASGGGQDRTTSGYQGVYAQSPVDIDSRFGQAGGMAGMLAGGIAGVPGIGTALSGLGGALDAARYNGTLAQNGLPGTVNPWGAAAGQMLASIGIPFTDLNLSRAFGVPTARERMDAIINGLPPGLYESGFGALAANQPVGQMTRESAPMASYPAGFLDWSSDIARSQAVVSPVEDPNAPMPTSSFFGGMFGLDPTGGKGAFDAGGWGAAQADKGGPDAQSTGSASDKGADASRGGDVSGSSGRGGDNDGGEYARGGMIGAPPGRYAAGGRVASNAAIRRQPPVNLYVPEYPPPPDAIRDQDFYRGRFTPRPDYPAPTGFGAVNSGAMRFGDAPGSADRNAVNPDAPFPPQEGYYAAGGNITPAQFGMLRAIDPPGPDDQIGALQTGEGVLTRRAMSNYPGLLDAANAGKLDPAKVQGLLAGAPKPTPRPRNKLKGMLS